MLFFIENSTVFYCNYIFETCEYTIKFLSRIIQMCGIVNLFSIRAAY